MADFIKVPQDRFKAVMRALLNTPPVPAKAIGGKRPRKTAALKRGPKKRPCRAEETPHAGAEETPR